MNFEDPQFEASYEQSVALYARYQMAIHGDDPSECSESEVLHDYHSTPAWKLLEMLHDSLFFKCTVLYIYFILLCKQTIILKMLP